MAETKNKLFINLILCLWLFASASLPMQARRVASAEDASPGIPFLIRSALSLDLSNEQKVKLKAVMSSRTEHMTELQKKAVQDMADYMNSTLSPTSTKAQLLKKNKQVQSSYEALRNYQLETWLFIRPILSEEQLNKLKSTQDLAFERVLDGKDKKES